MKTVRDLIAELQQYDLNLPVITPDFDEEGLCSVETSHVAVYVHKAVHSYQRDRLECVEDGDSKVIEQIQNSGKQIIGRAVLINVAKTLIEINFQHRDTSAPHSSSSNTPTWTDRPG
jgi:hypothetical protein